MTRIVPVILAGGAGARLWPLSTPERPKPFIAMQGGRTLIEETLARVADREFFHPPLIVANQVHESILQAQLPNMEMTLLLEPCARNTAPALAAAACHVLEQYGDAAMLVLPSDHMMARPDVFAASLPMAQALAAEHIVMFGMTPTHAETQYGYIRRGQDIAPGAYRVANFREKPDLSTAKYLLAEGGHDWNSGMFMFTPSILLDELKKHEPALFAHAKLAYEQARKHDGGMVLDEQAFARITAIAIDKAVMERTRRGAVIPLECGWSDIGHWESLWQAGEKDMHGNTASGDYTLNAVRDCYIKHDGGPAITLANVERLVVVTTKDAILITRRGDSAALRKQDA